MTCPVCATPLVRAVAPDRLVHTADGGHAELVDGELVAVGKIVSGAATVTLDMGT